MRGFRIELGEIESKLTEHGKIKEVAVIAKEIRERDNCLYAYYVTTGGTLEANDLREYLSKKLPSYMVPSYFIQLEEMPFTPSGKIDRKALIAMDENREKYFNYSSPTNEIEVKLVKYWQKVMSVKRIGIDDNIFDLGADSLSIMQVLTYVLKYKWNISMQDFYECQTIRSLSDRILNNQSSSDYKEMDISNFRIINPKMEEISACYRSKVNNVL